MVAAMTSRYPKRVCVYMQDWLPCRDGSGTNNRLYSNVRAYLDLGCDVEVICIQTKPDFQFQPDPTLAGARWTHLPAMNRHAGALFKRAAYWAGWPQGSALDYVFKTRPLIRAEAHRRETTAPGALHHFEYLSTACAAIDLKELRCVWSLHDIESNFLAGHLAMRWEVDGRQPRGWEKRSLKYLKRAEQLSALRNRLVLCIARHECEFLRREWGCDHAAFFPMSLPVEEPPPRARGWMEHGKLRLLHLGRIDSLPSFRSLQFLLEKVFPLLGSDGLGRMEMVVIGEIRDSERARAILELTRRYPQVKLVGFQKDIRPFYAQADLQVVGSTEATGLRTRIVESLAYGVPVLSTRVGAAGVEGLQEEENILLAEEAGAFARQILGLLQAPQRLVELARAGQRTYAKVYCRAVVAERLQDLLARYLAE
jgi:glycosyltransferase involved in cell wall biosynthesis